MRQMRRLAQEPAPPEPTRVDVPEILPPSARVRCAVAGMSGLALFIGFWHLQHRSFWQDEAYTWSTADRGLPSLVSVLVRHEGFQILHSLIEWPTNRISSTVDGLRTPSVLAFAATVPAVWLAGRRLFTERTGLLAALLFTLNGFALQYAQEARGYMLATALCAWAGALLAGFVLAPRRWTRVGWIACASLAIYAHGFATIAIAAQVAALWFLPTAKRRELHWIRNGALIALLAVPAMLAPLLQVSPVGLGAVAKPGISDVRSLVWAMAGRTASAIPVIGLGVLIALVVGVSVARRDLHSVETFRFALPILWMGMPAFLLMSVSFVHPVYLERYALWSVVAVVLLAAYGLTRIGGVNAVVMVVVVLLSVGLASRGVTRWYRSSPDQDFHSAMGELAPRIRANDAIVFSPDEVRLPSQFYLRSEVDLSELIPLFPSQPWGHFKTGDQKVVTVSRAVISQILERRYPRVWIVSNTMLGVLAARVNELQVDYRVASDRRYEGDVGVMLLELR